MKMITHKKTDCLEIGNYADPQSIRRFKKSRGETYAEIAERIRTQYPDEAAILDSWSAIGDRK